MEEQGLPDVVASPRPVFRLAGKEESDLPIRVDLLLSGGAARLLPPAD